MKDYKYKEYLLDINKYNRPTEVTDKDAVYILISRLMVLEPGSIQSRPKMGIGIVSQWRYSDAAELSKLKTTIKQQMATFLPELSLVNVDLDYSASTAQLNISMQIDDVIYNFKVADGVFSLSDIS